MVISRTFALVAILVLGTSWAGAECCVDCGCQDHCRKVCRLKCETKQITKIEYSCECEDFCVPGRSKKVGCDCCEKPIYQPTCADVRTKKKLIKHEVTKEVPTYRWVVESVCSHCTNRKPCQLAENTVTGEAKLASPAFASEKISSRKERASHLQLTVAGKRE